jgi:hypothetical protein
MWCLGLNLLVKLHALHGGVVPIGVTILLGLVIHHVEVVASRPNLGYCIPLLELFLVLILDMIEILPPLGKYKYDTWRILPVKCYINNSVDLQSCIKNVNKHFYRRCQCGSQYLLSVYRLHGVILTSIISIIDLSAATWLFVVVTGRCFVEPESPTVHHSFSRFRSRFISTGLLGFLIRQVSKKSNRMDPRMSFMLLADETLTEAWEHYHGFMIDLPIVGMGDWEFNQGFYCRLSQEAKEHIDALAGGTFFMLNAKKVQALLEKLSATERDSEEYGLKKDSHTTEIDPLTRKF